MKYIKGTVLGKPQELRVHLHNDWHFGSAAQNKDLMKKIKKDIEENEDNTRILINGDIFEMVTKNSKGDIYRQTLSPEQQIDAAVEFYKPYRSLIDAVTSGNHDQRLMIDSDIDPVLYFCRRLEIEEKYLKYEGIVGYSWNKCFYSIQMHHGSGGASSEAAIVTKMKKMKKSNAHVMYIGHHHKEVAKPYSTHVIDPYNSCVRKEKHWLVCGNTITNYAEYAEKFAYEEGFPSQGVLVMSGKPKHKNIEVEWIREM